MICIFTNTCQKGLYLKKRLKNNFYCLNYSNSFLGILNSNDCIGCNNRISACELKGVTSRFINVSTIKSRKIELPRVL